MATIEELKKALIQADQAGDTQAASLFASKIKDLRMQEGATPEAPPASTPYGVPESAAMKFAEGATLGFADEITGGMAAAMSYPASLFSDRISSETEGMGFGDRYEMYRNRERDRLEEVDNDNPVTSTASNIAGSVASAVIPASKGLTLFKAGQGTRGLMAAGAGEGLVYGGISGAGYSDADTAGDLASDTAVGSAFGGLTGGATPLLTQPLSAAGQAFASRFKPAVDQASDRVARAAKEAGVSTNTVADKLQDAGPDAMLVDVLGAPGQNLGRSAINASGQADDVLRGAVEARQMGQNDRVADTILDAAELSGPQTLTQIKDSIADKNRPAITRAYEAAREAGLDIPLMQFRDLMTVPMFKEAVAAARTSSQNYLPGKGPVGRLGFLDEVKKNLDAVQSAALRTGDYNRAAQARDIASALRTRVDDTIPEYGGARQLARDNFSEQTAADLGATGARQRVPADFVDAANAAQGNERSAIAQAYGAGMVDRLQNASSTPGSVNNILNRTRPREALQAALGPRAQPVLDQLGYERIYGGTNRALSGNSTTAKQLMSLGGPGALAGGGTFVATGDPVTSAATAVGLTAARAGGRRLLNSIDANNEQAVAPIVAEILAGRELPEAVVRALQTNPNLQGAVSRALAAQAGAAPN